MTFNEAATAFDDWMSCPVSTRQTRYRSRRTMQDFRTKLKALSKFFGQRKLRDIDYRQLREFQKIRTSNEDGRWAHPCGPTKLNSELSLLKRIMRLGEAWSSETEKSYMPLQKDEREIPKALTPEEQEHFLEVAASRKEWEVVHWYALLALDCMELGRNADAPPGKRQFGSADH